MYKGTFFLLFLLLLVKGNNIRAQDSVLVFRTLDSARQLPGDTSKVNWLIDKGKSLGRYFDKRGVENLFFQEAITLSQRIKYTSGLFNAYNETGISKRNRSEYLLATDYHQRALKCAEDARNDLWLCTALNSIGVDYRRMDDQLEKAFDYHFRALQLAEKINDLRNICIAINSIGNIHLSTEKYTEAINHFEKALELEKKEKNSLGTAINLGNIGYAYQGLGKLDLAIDYYKKSLAVNQQLNNHIGLAICYNSLGSAYQQKKDYARAHEYLNKALEVNGNVDDKVHVAESYLNIGKLWSQQGKHEEAHKYFLQCINLSLTWRFKYLLMEAYKAMANDYKASGEFKRSMEAMDTSLLYKDSLINEKSSLAWAQTQTIYEVDRKDNQIKLLEHDKQMSELRRKRNVVYTLSMAGFVLMLVVGGFFYIRHRNLETKRQTLQLELRSLRAQMNPHFIFNSLSSIHRFIWSNNPEEASDYLTKFSRLMRMILDNTQYTFISLNKELDSLRLYLDLEKLRCNDVFEYRITVADDINEEEVMIPPMIIQPYVENAIWHGLVHKSGKGLLEIAVTLKGKTLTCTVTDNGIGRKKAIEIKEKKGQTHRSMGMKVTEGRIDLIRKINNTKEADVNIIDLEDETGKATGTQVKLILPVEFIF
jgi:tetratricopeptide (TPR) repeat protein